MRYNLNGKNITSGFDYTDTKSNIGQIYQNIATFLAANNYQTAWEVIDKNNSKDVAKLFFLYNGCSLQDLANHNYFNPSIGAIS